jgi:ribosomal protein L11 methyltransferase
MATIEVAVSIPAFDHDALLAAVSGWDLNGAVQEEDGVRLYLPAEAWTDARRDALAEWLAGSGYAPEVDTRLVPPQNWNAVWEESIEPVRAGRFWVKPTWADLPEDATTGDASGDVHVIEIDPKMSFGTGHHATTRLALRLLGDAVEPGDRVLDVGTGTGVLAIAACRLGAASAIGCDVSDDAVENAAENVRRNGVASRVEIRAGTITAVDESGFDVACANVTRDVLLEVLPVLAEKTVPGGRLLLAGIFRRDRARMVDAAAEHGFALDEEATETGWWGGRFVRQEA